MDAKVINGNDAAAIGLDYCGVELFASYPITPASKVSERMSKIMAGDDTRRFVRIESEHSALSCIIGSQLAGIRSSTATSSVGLALMNEILGVAAGLRVPIIMPVANRALVSPWSLWCDHQDTMQCRDAGWMQVYAKSVQEIFDLITFSYKLAEIDTVLLPMMVCYDGFFLSHCMEKVDLPTKQEVNDFVGRYEIKNIGLDPNDPVIINNLTPPDLFTEIRHQQRSAFESALLTFESVSDQFYSRFGRKIVAVEDYLIEDADYVLVILGSAAGTAQYAAQELRKKGIKAGVARIVLYRPFPANDLRRLLKDKKAIGVLDRSPCFGMNGGPVYNEIRATIDDPQNVFGFVGGLGGRDLTEKTFIDIFEKLIDHGERSKQTCSKEVWIDLKETS
jgi:pyruvate ferredoxin oxidoreductase alpha subunit